MGALKEREESLKSQVSTDFILTVQYNLLGRLFKRSLADASQNRIPSHFHFAQLCYTAVSRKVVQLKSINKAYATNIERHDGLWLFTVSSSSSRVFSALEGSAMNTCLECLELKI